MDHTKSLKCEHRLHNIVVPEFRYIRAARVVSRGRDFNTLPNRTFVPFILVAQKRLLFEFVDRKGTLIANG